MGAVIGFRWESGVEGDETFVGTMEKDSKGGERSLGNGVHGRGVSLKASACFCEITCFSIEVKCSLNGEGSDHVK